MLSRKMLILYAGCLLDDVILGNGTPSVNGALPSLSPPLSYNRGSFTSFVSHNHTVA